MPVLLNLFGRDTLRTFEIFRDTFEVTKLYKKLIKKIKTYNCAAGNIFFFVTYGSLAVFEGQIKFINVILNLILRKSE
jgi:hypothetical protein